MPFGVVLDACHNRMASVPGLSAPHPAHTHTHTHTERERGGRETETERERESFLVRKRK